MIPDDLPKSKLSSALDGARVVYLDGRLHETAFIAAQEVITIFIYFSSHAYKLLLMYVTPSNSAGSNIH